MRKLLVSISFSACLMILFTTCTKEEENPFGSGNGQLSFWIQSDFSSGSIAVSVDNQPIGSINNFHPDGVDCGAADVNIIKSAGSYNWDASSASGLYWSGVININEGECKTMELTVGSGGGGGGGGGGGTGNCDWNSAVNCLQVTRLIGTRCGDPQSVEIKCKNICNQSLKIYTCIQKPDGTWYRGPDGTFSTGVTPNNTTTDYICKGTGQYRVFAMPISDYNANSCPPPSCN